MATQRIYSPQESSERFASLPTVVQNYLYSDEMTAALEDVGKKHSLHVDQIGSLEWEVVSVILGFTEPADFVEILEDALEIDEVQAQGIAKDVDVEIFQHVRTLMRSVLSESTPVGVSKDGEVTESPKTEEGARKVSFADEALAGHTKSIVKTIDMTPNSIKPDKYSADPYREPIV